MQRCLCSRLFSAGTLRSYRCKLRFLISVLRGLPRYARPPRCPDLRLNPNQGRSFTQGSAIRNRSGVGEVRYVQAAGFCSSSDRRDFKASPPIGIIQELSSLGEHFGHTFNTLSRHINVYFKQKDAHPIPLAENAGFVLPATPEYVSRLRKRHGGQRAVRERAVSREKDTATAQDLKRDDEMEKWSESQPEAGASPPNQSGVQLFHPSSLATRFGESYIYVANHINTLFSRGVEIQNDLEHLHSSRTSSRRQRAKIQTHTEEEPGGGIDGESAAQRSAGGNTSGNIAEGYLLFARHINRYFGAKVEHDAPSKDLLGDTTRQAVLGSYQKEPVEELSTSTATQINSSQVCQENTHSDSKGEGLFHSSSNTTLFGESYLHMENHVNRYFKGPTTPAEDDGDDSLSYLRALESQVYVSRAPKVVSLADCLRHPASAIPSLLGDYLRAAVPWASTQTTAPPPAGFKRKARERLSLSEFISIS